MLVISIQSQVVHGHVGNSAAVLPMQSFGITVAAVPTTLLSNHPRYPTVRGKVLDPELVAGLLKGVEERGLVETASAIVTGYLGSVGIAEVVADFVARALTARPHLTYVCDPVMGDTGSGLFVPPDLAAFIRDRLVPAAAIVTPNQFELGFLTALEPRSETALKEAHSALAGPRFLVATGCKLDDTKEGEIETVALDPHGLMRYPTPHLAIPPFGTGDLFTGLLVAWLAKGVPFRAAVEAAVAGAYAVIRRTADEGAEELQIERSIADFTAAERLSSAGGKPP